MSTARISALVATLLLPHLALAQAPAATPPNAITAPAQKTIGTPSARKYSEALIVLNARNATLAGQTLTLEGVAPSAILFASRPVRSAGHMLTGELLDIWTTGSFAKDPPNATVSAFAKDGSKVSDAVVVLRAPRRDGDKVAFDVTVLEGNLANADGPASVFIDTIWFSVGSGGLNYIGRSQTTGGTTPAIGSRDDTSTFTGWSNPAPDARPAYRSPYYGPNAPPDVTGPYRANCGLPPLLPCF
ncbi:MAG: hypothetical protein ACHQK9_01390 [Reyranellales bacterium]